MAHNINYNAQTDKHSFFSVKEKAWQGLGQTISGYPTSVEAIIYGVEKRPLFAGGANKDFWGNTGAIPDMKLPNHFATVRADTDQDLGVVGKDYQVVQNMDAFGFFDGIIGNKLHYETAGALGKGEVIFITAKLPDYIRVGRNDIIEKYMFLTSSHDGSGSINIAFTPVRVVCQNTLNAALKNSTGSTTIRHTASAAEKLKSAQQIVGRSMGLSVELEAVFNRWARVRVTDREVKRLIQMAMAPNRETFGYLQAGQKEQLPAHYTNVVDSVFEYAQNSPTQQEATTKGTLFGAYNAVTGYYQNVKSFKDGEAELKSILNGTGLQRGQAAYDLCLGFAKHGISALRLN